MTKTAQHSASESRGTQGRESTVQFVAKVTNRCTALEAAQDEVNPEDLTACSRDVAMVTDLWRVSAKIDTHRLHFVRWHCITDGRIATEITALTPAMIPLRLLKIS